MSRKKRIFSEIDRAKVKRMNKAGYSSGEIARSLGLSTKSYEYFALRLNTFGHLIRRQGSQNKHARKTRTDDCEKEGRCWGVKNWEKRRDDIKAKWPESEKIRRGHQQLPANEKIFGLDPRFQQRIDRRTKP